MHIFDNSEIKDVLDNIYNSNDELAIKLCWKYIEENESNDVNCICEYVISLFEGKQRLKEIMKKYKNCDQVSLASEIVRLISALEFGKNKRYKIVANEACKLVCDIGKRIQKEYDGYIEKEITTEAWMNGAILRGIALNLADFFYKKGDYNNELKMLGVRAVVTNSIMYDDLHFVGPSMVDYADCLARLKRIEEANKFYSVVVNDFKHFIDDYRLNPLKLVEEDYFSIKSLRVSLDALINNSSNVKTYKIMLSDVDMILNNSGYEENIQAK